VFCYQPLDGLSALLVQATETYPDHPDGPLVQTQLLTIAEQYKAVVREGTAAIAQGRFDGALASFERAQQLNPGLPIIVEAIDFVRTPDGTTSKRTTTAAQSHFWPDQQVQDGLWNASFRFMG